MAIDIIVKKTSYVSGHGEREACLVSCDSIGDEVLYKIQDGEVLHIKMTRPRNVKHHRKAFGLLNAVFMSQTAYSTLEDMLDDIKIALGHCRVFKGIDGSDRVVPLSISFSSMDQHSFNEFYDRMVDFILTKILPMTDRADLEQQVYNILGEAGPQQLEK